MQTLSKKVCLLGDFAVGKTSLIRRFVYNLFDDKYLSTIGVRVSRRLITSTANSLSVEMNMMLWDLAGRNGFKQVWSSYLRGASGGLLVCDLTRPPTLASLVSYAEELRAFNPDAHIIIAANKSDLLYRAEVVQQAEEIAAKCQARLFITSAKTANSVKEAFQHLGDLLIADTIPR